MAQEALSIFDKIRSNGIHSDVVSYTSLLNSYGRSEQPEKVIKRRQGRCAPLRYVLTPSRQVLQHNFSSKYKTKTDQALYLLLRIKFSRQNLCFRWWKWKVFSPMSLRKQQCSACSIAEIYLSSFLFRNFSLNIFV